MTDTNDSTPAPSRICPSCGEERPASAFKSSHPRTHCDECHAAKAKARELDAEIERAIVGDAGALTRRDDELVMGDETAAEVLRLEDELARANDTNAELLARIGDLEAMIAREAAIVREEEERAAARARRADLCPVLGLSLKSGATVRSRGVLMSSRAASAVRVVLTSGLTLDEIAGAVEWLRARGG